MMWFGYAHAASGLNIKIIDHVTISNKILINMLLAGLGGAIGAHLTSKLMIFFKLRKEKRRFEQYIDYGVDFE